jgi:hypothetical protein
MSSYESRSGEYAVTGEALHDNISDAIETHLPPDWRPVTLTEFNLFIADVPGLTGAAAAAIHNIADTLSSREYPVDPALPETIHEAIGPRSDDPREATMADIIGLFIPETRIQPVIAAFVELSGWTPSGGMADTLEELLQRWDVPLTVVGKRLEDIAEALEDTALRTPTPEDPEHTTRITDADVLPLWEAADWFRHAGTGVANAYDVHLIAHRELIERIRNPRPGEELWDTADGGESGGRGTAPDTGANPDPDPGEAEGGPIHIFDDDDPQRRPGPATPGAGTSAPKPWFTPEGREVVPGPDIPPPFSPRPPQPPAPDTTPRYDVDGRPEVVPGPDIPPPFADIPDPGGVPSLPESVPPGQSDGGNTEKPSVPEIPTPGAGISEHRPDAGSPEPGTVEPGSGTSTPPAGPEAAGGQTGGAPSDEGGEDSGNDNSPTPEAQEPENTSRPRFDSPYVEIEIVEGVVDTTGVGTNKAVQMTIGQDSSGELHTDAPLHGCTVAAVYIPGEQNTIGISHISPGVEHADREELGSLSVSFVETLAEQARQNGGSLDGAHIVIATCAPDPNRPRPSQAALGEEVDRAVAELNRIPGVVAEHVKYPNTDDGHSLGVSIVNGAPSIALDTSGQYTSRLSHPAPSDSVEF